MDKYKIYTLSVLRNEIKSYNVLKNERDKIIKDYQKGLQELKNEYLEYEEKLCLIKSPGKGDGLGGYVQESEEKFNYLISKKDEVEQKYFEYVDKNHKIFQTNLFAVDRRIQTVEYYLDKINDYDDKNFILDLYINKMKFKDVMERYDIKNDGNVTRKANNILKKIL